MTEQQQQQQPVQPVQPPAQPVQPPAQPVQPVQLPAQPVQPVQPPAQPAQPNVYQTIIEQKQAEIEALINHTNSLNNTITQMVQNGAQFSQPVQPAHPVQHPPEQVQAFAPDPQFPNYYDGQNPLVPFNPPSLASNQDWSLEALGKEIGKPRKED